jgi:predicted XRE-type DNA-binding protein
MKFACAWLGHLSREGSGGDLRAACISEEVTENCAGRYCPGAAAASCGADRQVARMKEKIRITRGSGNVFLDLGFSKAEAENLRLRSELMRRIDAYFRQSGMTQAAAAKTLGLTQPRFNALLKGRLGQFSLDALVNIASRAGLNVRLVIKKAA